MGRKHQITPKERRNLADIFWSTRYNGTSALCLATGLNAGTIHRALDEMLNDKWDKINIRVNITHNIEFTKRNERQKALRKELIRYNDSVPDHLKVNV